MQFASIRIITSDVGRLAGFYARLLGVEAERPSPLFAAFRGPSGTLAIGAASTVPAGLAEPGRNRSVIVELQVDDVDAVFEGLRDQVDTVEMPPTTMPWGNRSMLVRDPDGTLVNLFTPAPPV